MQDAWWSQNPQLLSSSSLSMRRWQPWNLSIDTLRHEGPCIELPETSRQAFMFGTLEERSLVLSLAREQGEQGTVLGTNWTWIPITPSLNQSVIPIYSCWNRGCGGTVRSSFYSTSISFQQLEGKGSRMLTATLIRLYCQSLTAKLLIAFLIFELQMD